MLRENWKEPTYLTHGMAKQLSNAQNSPSQASTIHELRTFRCSSQIQKRQQNQRSSCQHLQDNSRKTSTFASLTTLKAFDCVVTTNWEILKETGIPDRLTSLLRNLQAGQEATVRTGYGTMVWFQIGKAVCQGCILSPCLFNLYAEYIM